MSINKLMNIKLFGYIIGKTLVFISLSFAITLLLMEQTYTYLNMYEIED